MQPHLITRRACVAIPDEMPLERWLRPTRALRCYNVVSEGDLSHARTRKRRLPCAYAVWLAGRPFQHIVAFLDALPSGAFINAHAWKVGECILIARSMGMPSPKVRSLPARSQRVPRAFSIWCGMGNRASM